MKKVSAWRHSRLRMELVINCHAHSLSQKMMRTDHLKRCLVSYISMVRTPTNERDCNLQKTFCHMGSTFVVLISLVVVTQEVDGSLKGIRNNMILNLWWNICFKTREYLVLVFGVGAWECQQLYYTWNQIWAKLAVVCWIVVLQHLKMYSRQWPNRLISQWISQKLCLS